MGLDFLHVYHIYAQTDAHAHTKAHAHANSHTCTHTHEGRKGLTKTS
jgi:hypothetical protein